MKPNRIYLALALVAVLAVAGCGGGGKKSNTTSSAPAATTPTTSSTPSSGGGGENLKLSADPSGALKFDKSSLSAKAGNVTITMDNPSSIAHGVSIEGNGVSKTGKIVNQGGVSTLSASLKPGKYTFFCPVPGHRQAGMQGTLTVQ
jgi:plastocyanin